MREQDTRAARTLDLRQACTVVRGLQVTELRSWVERQWVRPLRVGEDLRFSGADVARLHLIVDLRDAMAVDEETIPVVLGLLDQLYDERNRVRALCDAIDAAGLTELVRRHLDGEPGGG